MTVHRTMVRLLAATACATMAAGAPAYADTPLRLVKAYEGNIDFTGTQASLRDKQGGAKSCIIASEGQASFSLPSGATVLAAHLYWAGSGATMDADVSIDGRAVSAPPERRYQSSIDGLSYFGAAVEVTDYVKGKASHSYKFAGLTVDNGSPYCYKNHKSNTVVAGFALLVVYVLPNGTYRTINVFEGFEALLNRSVSVTMGDFRGPAAPGAAKGRLGHIVWEGDLTGSQKGDTVAFDGTVLTNPPFATNDNNFNAKSSINSDETSIGVDFDAYELGGFGANQTSASARFTTEDDLVLIQAGILALPSVASADLSLDKSRSGELQVGRTVDYTLKVGNAGPGPDSAVQVVDKLPAQLEYVSFSGADWECSASGGSVTCSYKKPLLKGATASVTIRARVVASGSVTNTATVIGSNDADQRNNTGTSSGTATNPVSGAGYAFTRAGCTPGQPVVDEGAGCRRFTGPVVAGAPVSIHITAVSADGKAVALDAAAEKTVQLRFALECNDPDTSGGIGAMYGARLAACSKSGTTGANLSWTAASVKFAANTASADVQFQYADLGRIRLHMLDSGNVGQSVQFVSYPAVLETAFIRRKADQQANPKNDAATGVGFARAGEAFEVGLVAKGHNQEKLPSFGREAYFSSSAGDALVLGAAPSGALARLVQESAGQGAQKEPLPAQLTASFALAAGSAGTVVGTTAWHEVGSIGLTPTLADYLGTGIDITAAPSTVGRFYPAYFKTAVAGGFTCLPRMRCPAQGAAAIANAAFSGEPFDAAVTAYSESGAPLQYFAAGSGPDLNFIPDLGLSAAVAPGGKLFERIEGAEPFGMPPSVGRTVARPASFQLGVRFDRAAARSGGWRAPTAVYLRADSAENRAGTGAVQVSSLRAEAPAQSGEAGIMVINGRLHLASVLGSELLKTRIPMKAQYWTGTAWENVVTFDLGPSADFFKPVFSGCQRSLALTPATAIGAENCNPDVVKSLGGKPPRLDLGMGDYWLAAPKKTGSVHVHMKSAEWLPSMVGRVTFGQYRSPVIYIREMY